MKVKETSFQIILIFLAGILAIFIHYAQNKIEVINSRLYINEDVVLNVVKEEEKYEDKDITLILVGDVMLGRSVMKTSIDNNDFLYPFRKVADRLKTADLVFANLENPVINNCPIHEGGYKFCTTPEMLQGLVYAGVDIVSLVNNHSGNYGTEGLEETKRHLASVGIKYVEQGELTRFDISGVSFGFLGFDYVFKKPKEDDYLLINDANNKVDVLIVSPHWGVEYTSEPTMEQRDWAGRMVENGADVIVGHHPHWVQGHECVNISLPRGGWNDLTPGDFRCDSDSTPVYYSLGNFVFDQMWSENTKKGIVVEITYRDGVLIDQRIYDTYMSSWAQPEFR